VSEPVLLAPRKRVRPSVSRGDVLIFAGLAVLAFVGGYRAWRAWDDSGKRAAAKYASDQAERAQHEAEEREKNAAVAECERNGYTAVLGYGWTVVCVRAACVPNEGSPCL
jgi:hypothetical protein